MLVWPQASTGCRKFGLLGSLNLTRFCSSSIIYSCSALYQCKSKISQVQRYRLYCCCCCCASVYEYRYEVYVEYIAVRTAHVKFQVQYRRLYEGSIHGDMTGT